MSSSKGSAAGSGQKRQQFGFSFDQARCTGCHTCELACKDYHHLGGGVAFRTIHEFAGGTWRENPDGSWEQDVFAFYLSMSCNHCSNAACLRFCPSDSITKDDMGFVRVNEKTCVGCQSCMVACPYHAPRFDEALGHTVKCDGCRDRIEEGLQPVCVEACPQRALGFGIYNDLADHPAMVEKVGMMPDPQITQPNYAIEPCEFSRSSAATQARLLNCREV